jgi:hypothetical protein
MADSKRTNALIKKACGDNGDEFSLDVIIVSHLFWPTFKEESLTLPEPIQQYVGQQVTMTKTNDNAGNSRNTANSTSTLSALGN